MRAHRVLTCLVVFLAVSSVALAQGSGRLEGRVTTTEDLGVNGVSVVISETGATTLTDREGGYVLRNVPAGTYTVTFILSENRIAETGVEITAGETTRLDQVVEWDISFAETITVYSASRRVERIVEAPAAVTIVTDQEIEREATHGQLPKLLEFTPGAEVTQSGLYDFNFNTRGFNSSLNRRVLTLIDGREPSVPFLGAQEWAAVSFPLDDLASVEFVRGPGSALYGVDAFNGVLNMVTKAPRNSQGGTLRLTAGDLDTTRFDARYATDLGNEWYFKIQGGYQESDDFTRSRNQSVEYEGLDPEVIPLPFTDDEIAFGSLRLDKYFGAGARVLTLEGGTSTIEGPTFQTGIGRVQVTDTERPWARFNFNTPHFNLMSYFTGRDADDQISLRSGGALFLDSERVNVEFQGNSGFGGGKGFFVGGASYMEEDIDSANFQGNQTLMFSPRDEDFTGVYAQVEYAFTDSFKGVFAGRWDDSSLYDSQVSPRGSFVWAVTPHHTLRATYGEAFQTPNYSEFFLAVDVAPPVDLSGLEAICTAGGVACGFDSPTRLMALGNPTLEVEEIESFELGYNGIIAERAYITIDYYDSTFTNFITDLIFRINSTLGDINPVFNFYQPPAELMDPFRTLLLETIATLPPPIFPFLSNAPDGSPMVALLSYVNFGEVDTEGFELGLNYRAGDNWRFDLGYAYFDFETVQEIPEDPVIPNTAENKWNFGISYLGSNFDVALKYRYVDDFEWNAGVFRGPVPSYDVVSLVANYHINDHWRIGADVSNLFDDEHYESFGGDILERRALGHVQYSW